MTAFAGRTALVTGASSGIGRAAALAFAAEGASVAVSDIDADGAAETTALIRATGAIAETMRCDVGDGADVEALIARTMTVFGRLDLAFNNAGVGGTMGPLHEKTEREFESVLNVNLMGVWRCMKYEIPALVASGGGSIVNMASVAGLIGFQGAAAYCASKHAVIGLTRTAALELARQSIRVNAVCPGFTDTPMVNAMLEAYPAMSHAVTQGNPMRRLGTVDEIAAAVVWLCSDGASFITGQTLALDGGLTAS